MKNKLLRALILVSIIVSVNILLFPDISLAKSSIAVLNFRNTNQEAQDGNYGEGVASMVTTALVNTGKFKVIERAELQRILEEYKLGLSGIFDANTVKELGKVSGVEYVVVGSISRFGSLSEIDTRVLDTKTGEIVCAEFGTCTEDKNIRPILQSLAQEIAKDSLTPRKTSEKRIAIFTFNDNNNGKMVGDTIAEMLTTYLIQNSSLNIVERANFNKIIEEQKLSLTGVVSLDLAKKIGSILGADLVVMGNVTKFGNYFNVDVRMIDIGSGEISVSEPIDFSEISAVRGSTIAVGKKLRSSYFGEGILIISSVPSGAMVYLDDKSKGVTPVKLENISSGSHQLKLVKKHWEGWNEQIIISPKKTLEIKRELKSAFLYILATRSFSDSLAEILGIKSLGRDIEEMLKKETITELIVLSPSSIWKKTLQFQDKDGVQHSALIEIKTGESYVCKLSNGRNSDGWLKHIYAPSSSESVCLVNISLDGEMKKKVYTYKEITDAYDRIYSKDIYIEETIYPLRFYITFKANEEKTIIGGIFVPNKYLFNGIEIPRVIVMRLDL